MRTFRLFLIIVDETNNAYSFFSPFSCAALNQMSVDFKDQIEEISRCTERTKPIRLPLKYNADEIQNDGSW